MKYFNWMFKKAVPRVVYVPSDRVEEVLVAWDEYRSAIKTDSFALRRYRFWKLAEKTCPEIQAGAWTAEMYTSRPFFSEILK